MPKVRELHGSVRLAHTCNSSLDDGECMACGVRDCPHGEPLHYHHDGCPACTALHLAKEGS